MIRETIQKLPSFTRNFFFISGMFFLIWMFFIDANDIVSQAKLKNKLSKLENEKSYYEMNIEVVKAERDQLFSDQEMLEKFAREKYLMKKENEDVYVIVKQ